MKKYIYDIFQTRAKNDCSDLDIALAMLLSDARKGEQQYGPDGLDYAALHQDSDQLHAEDRELREFIGRHYDELVEAYQAKDRDSFNAVVDICITQDEQATACNGDTCEV